MNDEQMKYVCRECIADRYLASEVQAQYLPTKCGYCDKTREALTLENLADRTHDVLREHFVLTPEYPDEPHEYMEAREGRWERRGDPAEYAIAEVVGLDEKAAEDLTTLLSEKYGHWAIREGSEDPYGSDAMYERREPNDSEFRFTWEEFRREIQSRSRFFSTESEDMLRFVFGELSAHTTTDGRPVVREIKPDDPDASVWRARAALTVEQLEIILRHPSRELSAPPSGLAKPGRMNAQGIPVFYGAMELDTCVSEVRAPVGANVVVGQFQILRSVRLLDLDALSDVYAMGSFFDPSFSERLGRAEFLRHMGGEMSRPVMPQDEAMEYLTTQAVAEYLAHKVDPRIDGMIFLSTQTDGDGRNVVLFNHARRVKPQNSPEGANVEVQLPYRWLDNPGDEYGSIFVVETVPSNPAEKQPETGKIHGRRGPSRILFGIESGEPEDEGIPTLRLDIDSLRVLIMQRVNYSAKQLSVSRYRRTEEELSALDRF